MPAVYGFCPICGAEVESRTRGKPGSDECARGHIYLSCYTLPSLELKNFLAEIDSGLVTIRERFEQASIASPISKKEAKDYVGRCKRLLELIPFKIKERT